MSGTVPSTRRTSRTREKAATHLLGKTTHFLLRGLLLALKRTRLPRDVRADRIDEKDQPEVAHEGPSAASLGGNCPPTLSEDFGVLIQPACEEFLVRGIFYEVWAARVGSGTGVLPDSAGDPARALRGRTCTSMWLSLARICARRRSGHQS